MSLVLSDVFVAPLSLGYFETMPAMASPTMSLPSHSHFHHCYHHEVAVRAKGLVGRMVQHKQEEGGDTDILV